MTLARYLLAPLISCVFGAGVIAQETAEILERWRVDPPHLSELSAQELAELPWLDLVSAEMILRLHAEANCKGRPRSLDSR